MNRIVLPVLLRKAPARPALFYKTIGLGQSRHGGGNFFEGMRNGARSPFAGSIRRDLVERGPEIREYRRRFRRIHYPLGQQNAGELRLRIRIPGRSVAAIPAKPAK